MEKIFAKEIFFLEILKDFESGSEEDYSDECDDLGPLGAKSVSDSEKSESLLNIPLEIESSSENLTISRRKRFWKKFKKQAGKLRPHGKEGRSKDEQSLTGDSSPVSCGELSLNDQADSALRLNGDLAHSEDGLSISETERSTVVDDDALNKKVSAVDNKLSLLRSVPFFEMEIILKEGRDLVIRDLCGTSDPYVLFKIGNKQYYKSRTVLKNLNPKWDEKFSLPIEDPFKPIQVDVYDYDRGMNDDHMGSSSIHPAQLDLNQPVDLKLELWSKIHRGRSRQQWGYLIVQCTLKPKTQLEKEKYCFAGNQYMERKLRTTEQSKKTKTQMWNSVVTILLVEGHSLISLDRNGFSDPYVYFKLGNEKYKSHYKPKTLTPKWLEQFDLYMYDDQTSYLECACYDHDMGRRDELIGRHDFDLASLEREKTHSLELNLMNGEESTGFIKILLTVSGLTQFSDNNNESSQMNRSEIVKKYGFIHSLKHIDDVGWLQVKVFRAQGLASADIGGKSDPFCVLELVNTRVQTHTEYKTLTPIWNKTFVLPVGDIHSVLEVSVFDEDRDKKCDFLGKVAIPLLKIQNGKKVWYQLKDRKLVCRMRGSILLELDVVYNNFKAAFKTFHPKEDKFLIPEPRFRVAIMKHNIDRVLKMAHAFLDTGKFINSCFSWENKARSLLAFIVFLVVVWNFQLYMLPLLLLIIFIKNLLVVQVGDAILKEKKADVG